MPGLLFAAGRVYAARGELGAILTQRGKSPGAASIREETSETTKFGLGIGGTYSRSGEDGGEEGLGVDDEGYEGRSERSRGVVEL